MKHLLKSLFLFFAASSTFEYFLFRLFVNQPEIYFPFRPVYCVSSSLSAGFT